SLRRPHPQRRQACRLAGAAADEIRVGDQPQDCQRARARSAQLDAVARRRGDRMRRREFLTLVGGAAAGWPLAAQGALASEASGQRGTSRVRAPDTRPEPGSSARAEQATMPVVGLLDPTSPDAYADLSRAVRQGLKETGYVEGENVAIVYRFADNQIDRLPE